MKETWNIFLYFLRGKTLFNFQLFLCFKVPIRFGSVTTVWEKSHYKAFQANLRDLSGVTQGEVNSAAPQCSCGGMSETWPRWVRACRRWMVVMNTVVGVVQPPGLLGVCKCGLPWGDLACYPLKLSERFLLGSPGAIKAEAGRGISPAAQAELRWGADETHGPMAWPAEDLGPV